VGMGAHVPAGGAVSLAPLAPDQTGER
jgi:hypothetical protein